MKQFGLRVLVAFLLFSFGCKDWSKSARDKAEDVKQKAQLKMSKEQRKIESELNELDRWIDGSKVRAKESGPEAKAEFNKQMEELKEDSRRELEGLKSRSAKAWRNIRSRVDTVEDGLKRSYNRMRSHSE